MPITDADFEQERELEDWVFANVCSFFGEGVLLPAFRITTPSGKHGVPDGFVFSFSRRSWWIVECELLRHGVWPHIAEQITRFVVASRNSPTLRQIRDKLFEAVMAKGIHDRIASSFSIETARLFQQIELFIETVPPSLAIFIDDTNQDLTDFCDALDIPTEIYRVKKFVVNGSLEYYSPDQNAPAVVTIPEESGNTGSMVFDVIEQLGGGEWISNKSKCCKLHDGRIVKVQYSKLHERHQAYWFGINPASYETAKSLGCTHFVFVMGHDGFIVLPLETVNVHLITAYATRNVDGSIRHYHVHVSPPPDVVLKGYTNAEDADVSDFFSAWA